MKSWENLEPDTYRLMNKHYTPGRNGRSIRYLVRHHTAGVLTTDQVWNVWQDRQASAHYIVEPSGRIGQLVNDWDTAWANGNATANAESITIEHSNSAGAGQDWPISDATIEEGAHLAAALCRGYSLGRPEFGKNIRDHREFYGTSCPYHLASGGKYHQRYMDRAQYWYDRMANPAPNPATAQPEETDMGFNDEDRRMLREVHRELTQLLPSRSAYRHTDAPIDTMAGLVLDNNARIHEDWVHARAAEDGMDPTDWAAKNLGGKNQ